MTQFQAIDAAIQSPALKVLLSHWLQARGDRLMPAWRHIDPTVIGKYLPMVWAYRFDITLGTFIGRLAGEEIITVLGKSIRGRTLEQCFPADAAQIGLERYKMVIAGPRVMHSTGRVYEKVGRRGIGERLVLPLADDGINGDGVIGATDYQLNMGWTRRVSAAIDRHHDVKYYPVSDEDL